MAPETYYQITSDRFSFRKVIKSDMNLWLPFFIENPNLNYLGLVVDSSDEQLAKEWIETQLNRYSRGGFGHLAVIDKQTNELVAMGGIIERVVDGKDYLEIAFSVMPKHWGNGYATEMAQTLLKFGQANQLTEQFISMVHPENKASIKVAKKMGMSLLRMDEFSNIPVLIFGTDVSN